MANYGRTPCGFSLFERYALGFATPQVIDAAGSYSLEALHSSNTGYRLNTQVNKEFFLIENRQKTKWDAALPGHGMLIFRVDSTSSSVWNYNSVNNNSNHPYYELLRAGGVRSNSNSISAGTASDPFPGTRNVTAINNETSPNLKTWSGKLSNLAFRNIRESGGVITFDAYDVDVLTSISFTSDSYRLSIGSRLQLTTVQDPESASCTCVFTSDNEAVATVDANGMVTALSEGTCHITVTANGKLTDTCTVLVTQLTVAPDIASFIAMEEGIDVLLTLTNAQVLYAYSGDIYLPHASLTIRVPAERLNEMLDFIENLTSDTSFVAYFYANEIYTLSVTSSDETKGTVTGGGSFYGETDNTIAAEPIYTCKFVGWNDGVTENPRVVHLVSDTAFVAYFVDKEYYNVETTTNNEEWGTVEGGGVYMEGEDATLTVTTAPFCIFEGWSDGEWQLPRVVTVTQDTLFAAMFKYDSAWAAGIGQAGDLDFSVSPNPTTGRLTIRMVQPGEYEMRIYDMNGKAVVSRKYSEAVTEVDMSALPAGQYLLAVRSKEKQGIRTIVKK